MRRIARFLLLAVFSLAALLCGAARAGTVLDEPFGYAGGNLTAVSGGLWVAHSGAGNNPVTVTAGVATVRALGSSAEDLNRTLSPSIGSGAAYLSFRMRIINTPPLASGGDYFAHFNTSTLVARIWIQSVSASAGTYRVAATNTTSTASRAVQVARDLNPGETHLVVVRFVLGSPAVTTVWVDPTSESDPSGATATDAVNAASVSAFCLRQGSTFFGDAAVDDIRVGTRFADVSHVSMTAVSIGAPTAAQSATNVVVGKLAAAVQGAVTLTSMTLQASGTGDDATGIAAVKLWRDNGNGTFDAATDTQMTIAAAYPQDDGPVTLTAISGAAGALAGATTTALFVTYDTSAAVLTGRTFGFTVTTMTANVSATPDITGLPLSSATLTINANTSLSLNAPSPETSRSVQAGSGDQRILALRATAVGAPVTLTSLTITGGGSGNEAVELESARLFRAVSATATLLDTRTFSPGDRSVTFAISSSGEVGTQAVTAADLFVTYSVKSTATAGHTFSVSVTAAAAGGVPISGLPIGPQATLTVDVPAMPTLQFGAANPSGGNVSAGSTDVVVAGFTIAASATSSATVASIDAVASGSGDDRPAVVPSVKLALDANANGALDPGEALETKTYASDDGTITFAFGGTPLAVVSGTASRLLVAYSFASTVTGGSTFALSLRNAVAPGVSISGLPLASATRTVPAATLAFTGNAVASATVSAGTADNLVLDLTVAATENTASLTGIRVDALPGGTGNDLGDVAAVRLFEDDGDGVFEPASGDAALNGAGQQFNVNNGFVTLSTGGVAMGLGASKRLFVSYTLTAGATGGGTFAPRVTAITAQNGAASGLPVDGATLQVRGGTLSFAAQSLPGREVAAGAQDELIASLLATASGSAVVLSGFDAKASGTGDDATEISSVSLFRDANGNDVLEPATDTLLDRRRFATNDGTATLSTSGQPGLSPVTVTAGGAVRLFVALSVSTSAIPTHDFRLTLQNALVTGGAAGPLSIVTSALEVRPGLVLFAAANPANASVASGASGVVVGAFKITTASGPQAITSFAVAASGTGNDASRVTAVKLYRDNFDGVFNGFDTLVDARTWPADDGRLVFAFAGGQIVNTGLGVEFFLVYDLSATSGPAQTFRATVEGAEVVLGRANGLPLDSSTITVLPAGFGGGGGGSTGGNGGGGGGCAAVAAGAGAADPAAALPYAALVLGIALARASRRRSIA